MAPLSTTTVSAGEEIVEGIWSLIIGIIAIIAIAIHTFYTGQDLFTTERKSIVRSNGKAASTRTASYILGAYLKEFAVVAFGINMVLNAISHNFWSSSFGDCVTISIIIVAAWKFGMAAQYLIYILNLYQCYPWDAKSTKPFGFQTQKLIGIAVANVLFCFIFTVGLVVTSLSYGQMEIDVDNSWPYHCVLMVDADEALAGAIIFGVLVIVWDVMLSIGSLRAYNQSFNGLLDWIKQNKKNDNNDPTYDADKTEKLLYTCYKYKTIVLCSTTLTIIWLIVLFARLFVIGRMLALLDILISMICIMLMTPYYRNDYWFKSLCCLCILCDSNRKNYTGENKDKDVIDVSNMYGKYVKDIELKNNN